MGYVWRCERKKDQVYIPPPARYPSDEAQHSTWSLIGEAAILSTLLVIMFGVAVMAWAAWLDLCVMTAAWIGGAK